MENSYAIVMTMTDTRESAERMARALVEGRLAACVNIVAGVESVYRWEGRIESAQELLLMIKTRESLFGQVEAAIRSCIRTSCRSACW